jgi:hypothetical protein
LAERIGLSSRWVLEPKIWFDWISYLVNRIYFCI